MIWKLSLIDVVLYNKNNGLKIPMILMITVTVQKCELMWTKGNRYQHLNYELFVLIVPVNLPFFKIYLQLSLFCINVSQQQVKNCRNE